MIRIRTRIGGKCVVTLCYNGKWITIGPGNGDAYNLLDAGQNHLAAARKLREMESKKDS